MTTLAQVQTDANTLLADLNGLLNTACDKLNPDKTNTPQIIALLNSTINQLTALIADTAAKAQALGVT